MSSERHPTQREIAGHSPLQSWRAQRVSLRTALHRITRELALAIVIFHPGCNSGCFCDQTFKEKFHLGCYSGKKSKFPRLFAKKQELIREHEFLGADSVSDKLKRN